MHKRAFRRGSRIRESFLPWALVEAISSKYLPYAFLDFDISQVLIKPVSGTPENPLV
jgi:hypothetical protein